MKFDVAHAARNADGDTVFKHAGEGLEIVEIPLVIFQSAVFGVAGQMGAHNGNREPVVVVAGKDTEESDVPGPRSAAGGRRGCR